MDCTITGDCDHDSGLPDVLLWLNQPEQEEAFAKDYGEGLASLAVILVCSKHIVDVKPRIRHSKKEKRLYMDIMLVYTEFVLLTAENKKARVLEALLEDVPRIVRKYKFADFDTELFISDFNRYFSGLLAALPRTPALAA
ncbi:hypothetical protein CR152_30825 [Massilia violaceinigra]|uniref:Uncharacterized protein n=1 Tax=Massilia violaceinigra TaxID=2045208 RepID=A0A2D2DTW1_9BURK|nr:hypothetical protein [Massilia violaceinigra]ATQ78418.1 hypothetical protein CR152_30825 [Massilia violaceinigra]